MSEYYLGWHVSPETAKRLCARLDLATELANGHFTWEYVGDITVFKSPRKLGVTCHRIAKATIDGFRIGALES